MRMGGPRRRRLIHWLNLPGYSPLIGFSVFCVVGKKFHIAGKGTGFFCAFLLWYFRYQRKFYGEALPWACKIFDGKGGSSDNIKSAFYFI